MGKPTRRVMKIFLITLLVGLVLVSCSTSTPTEGIFSVTIQVDGKQITADVPAGSTVQLVLDKAGITLGNLDRVDPPDYTLLTGATTIQVTRVREVFEVEESILPFSRQVVKNESPPNQSKIDRSGRHSWPAANHIPKCF